MAMQFRKMVLLAMLVSCVTSLPARKRSRQLLASSTSPPEHVNLQPFNHGQRLLQPYPVLELQALAPESQASGIHAQFRAPQQVEFASPTPQQSVHEEQRHHQAVEDHRSHQAVEDHRPHQAVEDHHQAATGHREPEHIARESASQNVDSSYNDFSEPRDYRFHYVVNDDYSGNYQAREETKEGHRVTGSYSLREPTGALRIVKYVADENGFRAIVHRVWDQKRT